MKTVITAAQTREADRHTIETHPIASIDLMEKASAAFVTVFMQCYPDKNTQVLICCGTGNNGGDGLAIARLLQEHSYDAVTVWVARFGGRESDDFAANLARLRNTPIPVTELLADTALPPVQQDVVIDALLGSGLNKPLQGDWLRLVEHINHAERPIVAVDIPTGLRADGVIDTTEPTVQARHVISFQRPKLSFFFPESARAVGQFHVVDIGLDEGFIETLPGDFKLIEPGDIQQVYRPRTSFSHKGTYGHALIVAGNTETMGAALLACGACLYSGAGRTTACIPETGLPALNTRLPEVMYRAPTELRDKWNQFDAIGIGPGLGLDLGSTDRLPIIEECIGSVDKPMVVDADALTYLAPYGRKGIGPLPKGSILTPHMKEFDRLFGIHNSWWDRVATAREQAMRHQLIIVLKNRYTFIALSDGRVLINPTGNPAMASGGMGDVLTGMLTAFLAQGYAPSEAALLGCYLHGAAGDRLAHDAGMGVIPAGQLIQAIPTILGSLPQVN